MIKPAGLRARRKGAADRALIVRRGGHMNKNDLVDAIASRIDLPKTRIAATLDIALDVIAKALKKGDEVRLSGFGTFYVSHRAAIRGRNPRTGEPIAIKAGRVPKFRAGKSLKAAIG